MADIIQLLPDAIANQIAAGEVVQRPASVVKELIENAVDAGASQIKVVIKEAGKTLIQVIDNGCGMSESDARMSFERHATSKIRKAEDLFAIRTMGFRGEALASVAAVAQVEMRTRRKADELGTRVVIEGSKFILREPCQSAPGTSVSVKNLFFNVPARRNFLKSSAAEMRHILDEFQRIAFANPDLSFSLHHNGEELFALPAGNLRQRVIRILKGNSNQKLVPVNEDAGIVKLRGFIGKPEYAKKVRGEQWFFVNNRFIRSPYLHHAMNSAYEDLLAGDQYPLYLIFIDIDPAQIDINVHPTKQEIKFEDERLVYNYLKVAVKHALGRYNVMPTLDFDRENSFPDMPAPAYEARLSGEQARTTTPTTEFSSRATTKGKAERREWENLLRDLSRPESEPAEQSENDVLATIESNWESGDVDGEAKDRSLAARAVDPCQVHASYIVSPIKSGFLLIDQQAAHERVLYEQYRRLLRQQTAATQRQLFSRTITLSPADAALMDELLDTINQMGFDVRRFGGETFVVNGAPADLAGKYDETALLEQLLEQYKKNVELELEPRDNIARALAKSAAIKRGQPMSKEEMRALIDRLFACENPFKSPSGRNCFLTFELEELEKRFWG
jgi:DNA mismatch repair protein MutL